MHVKISSAKWQAFCLGGHIHTWHIHWAIIGSAIMSSNVNIYCITGPLWGESTGRCCIPLTKANYAELWCFLKICAASTNGWTNTRDAGDLRWHRAHNDLTVMTDGFLASKHYLSQFRHVLIQWNVAETQSSLSTKCINKSSRKRIFMDTSNSQFILHDMCAFMYQCCALPSGLDMLFSCYNVGKARTVGIIIGLPLSDICDFSALSYANICFVWLCVSIKVIWNKWGLNIHTCY